MGLGIAGEVIPGMDKKTILHAGPPVTWERMCGPQKGAVMGGLIYEGLAKDLKEAEELAASGQIKFDPCHMHSAVGPMAGVVTASMPVWIMENKTFGNRAYCTFNEGLGKVLRFGACDDEVLTRLRWLETDLYPVLRDAMKLKGEIDVKVLIAKLLQMGDEAHNRNEAGTSLLIRELVAPIMALDIPEEKRSPPSTSSTATTIRSSTSPCRPASARWIRSSTSRTARCCHHVPQRHGLRHPHRGPRAGQVVHRPGGDGQGLYFPGFDESDAAPDLGDSCITETAGIGGFCMAAAPAIVQFVGGQVSDAINYSTQMYEITVGEGQAYKIPALNFRGSATGIDLLKVIETGIRPIINTGIAHKDPGVGQVGAGLVNPPEECFKKALAACAEAWG